jgi:ABC-type sugar transport system ATPase subunit
VGFTWKKGCKLDVRELLSQLRETSEKKVSIAKANNKHEDLIILD